MFQLALVVICFIGYLQPFHSAPWPSAINDGIFLIFGFLFIINSIYKSKNHTIHLSIKEVALITVLLIHVALSTYTYDGKSIYPYILLISTTYLCYKISNQNKVNVYYLIIGTWISATVTALLGIGQWIGAWDQFDGRFLWMTDVDPGTRLSGNLGQPNNAGTFLIWGLLCGLFIAEKVESSSLGSHLKAIFHGMMTSSILLITIASALTQSRTTTLSFIIISAIAISFKHICGNRILKTLLIACTINISIVFFINLIASFLFDTDITSAFGGRGIGSDARLEAYSIFIRAILEKPFFGYGIGGMSTAFIDGIQLKTHLGTYFGNSHNIIIDFFVWFGIPLGALLLFLLVRFYFQALKKVNSPNTLILFLIITTAITHAMLEYPLNYPYFLIPFALFSGQFITPNKSIFFASKKLTSYFLIALTILFTTLAVEYLRLESEIRQARLEISITGKSHPVKKQNFSLINELENANYSLRIDIDNHMDSEQLALIEKNTTQFPMQFFIDKTIEAMVLNNRPDRAEFWRKKACYIYGEKYCLTVARSGANAPSLPAHPASKASSQISL